MLTSGKNQPDRTIEIGGLELFLFGASIQPALPWVFITHGLTGTISDCQNYALELDRRGFLVLGIEHRDHGRRRVSDTVLDIYAVDGPREILGIVQGTALDISLAIDLLQARFGVLPPAIGVTGHSLGGRTALTAMLLDDRIDACAAFLATGDFAAFLEHQYKRRGFSRNDIERRLDPSCRTLIRRFDPISNLDRLRDRPLLVTSGGRDPVVPAVCVEAFHDDLKPHYPTGDHLRLVTHPDTGHEVTPAMMRDGADWLDHWLARR